jgi:hypothetical protein
MPTPTATAGTAGTPGQVAGLPAGVSLSQQVIGRLVQQIGSANWSKWQWIRWVFYDYVRVPNTAAGNTPLIFFTNNLGQADTFSGIQKTLEWTNMPQQGQFGQNYFVIQEIRSHLQLVPKARQNATVAATTNYTYDQMVFSQRYKTALSTGVLDFTIGQKQYWHMQQPFRTCPPGFGLTQVIVPFDLVASATGNAYLAQSNNLSDVYGVSPPQLIEPSQQFTATVSFPDLGYNFHNCLDASGQNAAVEAGIILDGYIFRPMQ